MRYKWVSVCRRDVEQSFLCGDALANDKILLRDEKELPADVRALLHAPLPEDVWYVPSTVRFGNPYRFASKLTLGILIFALALFLPTALRDASKGKFLSDGFAITLSMVLFAAVFYSICRRLSKNAERIERDLNDGHLRFGLWLSPRHVMARDMEGIRAASRKDIEKTHVYHAGNGRPDLLVITLRNRERIYVMVNALDGWLNQADKLGSEFQSRLSGIPGISRQQIVQMADACLPRKHFSEFMKWLDGEAGRLKAGKTDRLALLEMADAALTSWPDSARDAQAFDEWFLLTEGGDTWEYGVGEQVSDYRYLGFKESGAFWLLPLCRTVYFFEAESIFPNVASVEACARTFQQVPLTSINFTGGMDTAVFDAFLAWAATKPLKTLKSRNYSTQRNSVSNLEEFLVVRLADFKRLHNLA